VARHLARQQGENLHLVQRLLGAGGLGRLGGAQGRKKCLARACGLEGLEKVLDGAKSIPRCSISLAPDSSPNPSRTMLLTCSWVKG
jgi:hypothetical protein